MGKHNSVSEHDELLAQVDADTRPLTIEAAKYAEKHARFMASMWGVDEFIASFTNYLRDTFESAYGKDSDIHIEDAASHAYAAAENFFYSVTNFRR